jgi:hypothetical protein
MKVLLIPRKAKITNFVHYLSRLSWLDVYEFVQWVSEFINLLIMLIVVGLFRLERTFPAVMGLLKVRYKKALLFWSLLIFFSFFFFLSFLSAILLPSRVREIIKIYWSDYVYRCWLCLFLFRLFCRADFQASRAQSERDNKDLLVILLIIVVVAQISSREDVMVYLNKSLLPLAFPWTDMTGRDLHWRQRLFASDGEAFRVGPVRVRQVRMPIGKLCHCQVLF